MLLLPLLLHCCSFCCCCWCWYSDCLAAAATVALLLLLPLLLPLLPLLQARTYVLAIALNAVKDLYANPSDEEQELVIACSGIKAAVTWNAENATTVCRERCGGQGYLSANRFGQILGFAHAGMTAEGGRERTHTPCSTHNSSPQLMNTDLSLRVTAVV